MRKGFSLVTALLVMVIVSVTVAVLTKLFVGTLKVQTQVRTFNTVREAGETVAYTAAQKLSDDELSCANGVPECQQLNPPKDCTDEVINGTLKEALENSGIKNATVYLLSKCNNLYVFEIDATKNGAQVKIIFGYQK